MTDARTLTRALEGRWYNGYGLARCPAHGDRHPSMTLADGRGGRLLLKCMAGCSFPAIRAALQARGCLDEAEPPQPPSATELARHRAEEQAAAAKGERQALRCWRQSLPVHGTLAETYLREGRGITCALPDILRFHPACWHPSAQRLPALVARVDGLPRLAVHRTYLRTDGRGKADVAPTKAMLGATRGGALRARHGRGTLVVAEGIETALSLCCGLIPDSFAVWAALSHAGMAGLCLPGPPRRLLIAVDGDDPGRSAAEALSRRAATLGWQVQLLQAPEGRDFNDVLLDRRSR